MTRLLVLSFLASLAAAPLPASAQARTVVVLPQLQGDATSPRRRARGAVALALGAEGLEVRTEVPEALRSCARGVCIPEVLDATESELAARVTLWARPDSAAEAGELVVGLVTREELSYEGSASLEGVERPTVDEPALAQAANTAVHQAYARLIVGPGPFLLVHGAPFGASVYLDGELAGGLPWNGRVEPGQHEVRVERPGFLTQTHTVHLADDLTARQELEVALVSEGGGGGSDAAPHIVGASLLGAAGLALLVTGIVTYASGNCSSELPMGRCAIGSPADEDAALGLTIAGGRLSRGRSLGSRSASAPVPQGDPARSRHA